ncbi:MAG: POTRA domain-containing protein, partial [bacterium]
MRRFSWNRKEPLGGEWGRRLWGGVISMIAAVALLIVPAPASAFAARPSSAWTRGAERAAQPFVRAEAAADTSRAPHGPTDPRTTPSDRDTAGTRPGDEPAPKTAEHRTLRLESVEIHGNNRTSDDIIMRHLTLSPGDEVNVDNLEANRRRLLATDYFESVEFSTRPGSERGRVILVIDVRERGFPTFETGFGYDDLYGWFLTLLGLRVDNPLDVEVSEENPQEGEHAALIRSVEPT